VSRNKLEVAEEIVVQKYGCQVMNLVNPNWRFIFPEEITQNREMDSTFDQF